MSANNNSTVEALAARIKISILNQGFWNARKQHKSETREENFRHNLDNDAEVYVRVTKHDSLMKAAALKGQIYNQHRHLTLPSPVDGLRVVPVGREFEHMNKIADLREKFNNQIQNFLNDYDNVVETAQKRLNGLFDSTMFPPKEIMKSKFYNQVKYMECPSSGQWAEWIGETAQLGQAELQDRIVSSARKLIEVCSGDGKLYSSVLDNLAEICEMAGDFNLLEDPLIAKAAKELLPVAQDFDAETLRDSKGLRRATADRASEILSILNLS
jgi:hypothetical protein